MPNDWAVLWVLSCTLLLTICSYHLTYRFNTESTLYSCLNIKELLTGSRQDIWSSSDCNEIRTLNHLVRKRKLSHFAKLAKWLSFVEITYLYNCRTASRLDSFPTDVFREQIPDCHIPHGHFPHLKIPWTLPRRRLPRQDIFLTKAFSPQ